MLFTFTQTFVALIAASTVLASPSSYTNIKRQSDTVACTFVFKPEVPVDPSVTDVVADFNFIIGRSLSIAAGGAIFNAGASFVENLDNTFSVADTVSADGKSATETAAVVAGFAGTTQEGFSGTEWLISEAECA